MKESRKTMQFCHLLLVYLSNLYAKSLLQTFLTWKNHTLYIFNKTPKPKHVFHLYFTDVNFICYFKCVLQSD